MNSSLPYVTADNARPLRILIADDEDFNRTYLQMLLCAQGYQCLEARNGKQAVDTFSEQQPDIVIMDVLMPTMDGYEATRLIKAQSQHSHVPVIFLTGLTDTPALSKCIASGGDDFITKPFNELILTAKINAHARIRRLTLDIEASNKQLAYFKSLTEREHVIAERVLTRTLASGQVQPANVRTHLSPVALFNGDMFQTAVSPYGDLFVLLGDFTGHGLSAAIGTLPVNEVFHALVRNERGVGQIAFELNRRLSNILPDDMFFAAAILSLSRDGTELNLWSGGLPEIILTDCRGNMREKLAPQHMPLGILQDFEFDTAVQSRKLNVGDRLYLYTDGVTEARGTNGEMFGDQRLIETLAAANDQDRIAFVLRTLKNFTSGHDQTDDISLIEISAAPVATDDAEAPLDTTKTGRPGSFPWNLSIPLRGEALCTVNPVPYLFDVLSRTDIPVDHRDIICTLLSELYSNAVEHGVLGLDSSAKDAEEGYIEYYAKRVHELPQVTKGFVNLSIGYVPLATGGRLTMTVQDSGTGFLSDPINVHSTADDERFHGLDMLRELCESLNYDRATNTMHAVYRWSVPST